MNLNSIDISLYIHIPFCNSKCKYCDFYSETVDFDRIPSVITEIINQLNKRYIEFGRPNIKTIFIGGGTPSLIPLPHLERLFIAIKKLAPNPIEWTIESNPESISLPFLSLCSEFGINRLSIGIQSSNDRILQTLGRRANNETIQKAMSIVQNNWNSSFSLDFISSVPGQTKYDVENDINFALQFKPDHISFYALSLEIGTKLEDEVSKGLIEELDDNTSEKNWLYGRQLLKEAGYNNYEVSNYTINSPCQHNINYWELKPYLGIGPSAVSTIIDSNGEILRISNDKSITKFLQGESNNWGEVREILSPKSFFEDYIIMGFRLKSGINIKRFEKIFNVDLIKALPIINELIKEKLIIKDSEQVKLTNSGFDIMNNILVRILESTEEIKIDNAHWFY